MKVGEIRIATDADFQEFRDFVDSTDASWRERYNKNGVRVWLQDSKESEIRVVKVQSTFELPASVVYDTLHDPEFRKTWDENMIEGKDLFQLDANNDVGYYAVRLPAPLKNRDFLNQRSWFASPDKEYIIMNHTVAHHECPPKKEFVRAISILTGYMVRATGENTCQFTYLSQTDPRGSIPKAFVNKAAETFAPKVIAKLYENCKKYPAWKSKNNPDYKPWINFDPTKARIVPISELTTSNSDFSNALGAKDETVVSDDAIATDE